MKKLLSIFSAFFLLLIPLFSPLPVHAADVRAGEEVHIADTVENLKDLYAAGGTVTIDAPIINDLTVAGGDLIISGPVSNSILAAGGNITIKGRIGNNARIAGGNIIIDAPIANDLVITGGSITITKNAAIGGDILFAGGNLIVNGPVTGKMMVNGGKIVINAPVGGNVNGEVGKLTLGEQAKVQGNLSYTSSEKAQIAPGATIAGKTDYHPQVKSDRQDEVREVVTKAAVYKLVSDILLSILFIYFFSRGLGTVLKRMKTSPAQSGAIGFAFFFLAPIAGFFFLILLWLGFATWLFYLLVFILALFILKIFLGWFILRWWYARQHKQYVLDWQAGVLGPIVLAILLFIPVLGWLAAAIIFFIALGALVTAMVDLAAGHIMSKAPGKK